MEITSRSISSDIRGGGEMAADAMSRKNPFEPESGETFHGVRLALPVMPACGTGRPEFLASGIPGQMVAGEKIGVFPQKAAGSGRVSGDRNDHGVVVQTVRIVPFQADFDGSCLPGDVRLMEDPEAAKMPAEFFVIRDVVLVGEEEEGNTPEFFDASHQGFGETGRVHKDVALGPPDPVTCRTIAFR